MSRRLTAILVSSALVFGNVSSSAWAATETSIAATEAGVDATKNPSPLPPGGAAGIRQAQGSTRTLIGIGIIAGFIAIAWLVLDDDDDDDATSSSTGT